MADAKTLAARTAHPSKNSAAAGKFVRGRAGLRLATEGGPSSGHCAFQMNLQDICWA